MSPIEPENDIKRPQNEVLGDDGVELETKVLHNPLWKFFKKSVLKLKKRLCVNLLQEKRYKRFFWLAEASKFSLPSPRETLFLKKKMKK